LTLNASASSSLSLNELAFASHDSSAIFGPKGLLPPICEIFRGQDPVEQQRRERYLLSIANQQHDSGNDGNSSDGRRDRQGDGGKNRRHTAPNKEPSAMRGRHPSFALHVRVPFPSRVKVREVDDWFRLFAVDLHCNLVFRTTYNRAMSMTIKNIIVSASELSIVRIQCTTPGCTATTELTLDQLADSRNPMPCAGCREVLQSPPPNNQLTEFAVKLKRLVESHKGRVQFVLPVKD
jgi:hypothetical protein